MHQFDPITIDDSDGDELRISVGMDADWRQCVDVAARANVHPHTSAGLDPAGARAAARALLEAADEAELRNLEAESRGYCPTCGSRCVAVRYPIGVDAKPPTYGTSCAHNGAHQYPALTP